jgi:hypothetical protein
MGMTISFARHQFPPAIIQHAVWLYVRFTLSSRDVEELLAERGPDLSYETARRWVSKFGPLFAREPRRQRPRPTSRWRLDEMARFRALGSGSEIGRRIRISRFGGVSARCSVSNLPDQRNGSVSVHAATPSTSRAISHPATRCACSGTNRPGRGQPLALPETELKLRDFPAAKFKFP